MSIVNLNISIDDDLKNKAQSVFEPLGIDMSMAVNILLRKLLFSHEISLDNLKVTPVEKKTVGKLLVV